MRLVLHIGAGKCGSSSIQTCLRVNQRALLERGYLVPPNTLTADGELTGEHVWYFEARSLQDREAALRTFSSDLTRVVKSAPDHVHSIVLSAENLMNPTGLHALFKDACDEVVVRAYVRRQDEYLESAWKQWYCKIESDMDVWLDHRLGTEGNWRASLEPWLETFGREAIQVQKFERASLVGGDIAKDFLASLGVESSDLVFPPPSNLTLNAGFTRLLELSQTVHRNAHDNRLAVLVEKFAPGRHLRAEGEWLMSGAMRLAIMKRFSETNEWVRNRFFIDCSTRELFDVHDVRASDTPIDRDIVERQMWALVVDLIIEFASLQNKR